MGRKKTMKTATILRKRSWFQKGFTSARRDEDPLTTDDIEFYRGHPRALLMDLKRIGVTAKKQAYEWLDGYEKGLDVRYG